MRNVEVPMVLYEHWTGDKIEIKTLQSAVRVYQVAWELLGTRLVVRLTEHDSHQLLGLQGGLQLSPSDILHLHA